MQRPFDTSPQQLITLQHCEFPFNQCFWQTLPPVSPSCSSGDPVNKLLLHPETTVYICDLT